MFVLTLNLHVATSVDWFDQFPADTFLLLLYCLTCYTSFVFYMLHTSIDWF